MAQVPVNVIYCAKLMEFDLKRRLYIQEPKPKMNPRPKVLKYQSQSEILPFVCINSSVFASHLII